jgi:hypothetical protein
MDDDDEVLDFMEAAQIESLGLSRERLQAAYNDGSLGHLTVVEIGELLASAQRREMLATILR